MSLKAAELIYGVDDRPSWGVSLVLALQHVVIASAYFVFPAMVVHAAGGGAQVMSEVLAMCALTVGLGSILQCLGRWGIGSGYLLPHNTNSIYLAACLAAVPVGGLPLVWGMTLCAGLAQALLSRVLHRLRPLFPPEVCGVVVVMMGFSMIRLAVVRLAGVEDGEILPRAEEALVGVLTLATMVGLTVWSRGRLRAYSLLIGLLVGTVASVSTGLLGRRHLDQLLSMPLVDLPTLPHLAWSFDPELIIPFLVAMIASTLRATGLLVSAQQVADDGWKRADLGSVGRGVLADAAGSFLAGLGGAFPTTVSSSSAGVVAATGAAAPRIGLAYGLLMVALALLPGFGALYDQMPLPVIGAVLVYAACYLFLGGMRLILSRMIDARRTFLVGLSITIGLSVDILPSIYQDVPPWAQTLAHSPLTLATAAAMILNLIFRLGVPDSSRLVLAAGPEAGREAYRFMHHLGAAWGARTEVMARATSTLVELMETLHRLELARGLVTIEARFDEFNLDLDVAYAGTALEFPDQRPRRNAILDSDPALAALSGYLVHRLADRASVIAQGWHCQVTLHFDH